MLAMLTTVVAVALAAAGEKPALIVEGGADPPVRITRADVLTPADGPPVILFAAVNQTDRAVDTFTVMAFVFKADGTPKARQVAPARRTLEARETKYSTVVVDGGPVDASDIIVIGVNQAQHAGSSDWWRAELRAAAEAKVPLKKQ
jgi:anthranilate phosphoribosyltransferase